MIRPSRSVLGLVVALLAIEASLRPAMAQDTPLYRDPSPTEGPRIDGPLLAPLPPRASSTPPPPSSLGPFQSGRSETSTTAEPIRDPLLIVQPIPPPLPALPLPMMPSVGTVLIRRKTMIRPPNGPCGRCHEWLREALFGPPRPPVETTYDGSKQGFFFSHLRPYSTDATPMPSSWQPPVWPLSGDR